MKNISLSEFQRCFERVMEEIQNGNTVVITNAGAPIARLVPTGQLEEPNPDDPFYRLYELASDGAEPLSNDQIDAEIYGL